MTHRKRTLSLPKITDLLSWFKSHTKDKNEKSLTFVYNEINDHTDELSWDLDIKSQKLISEITKTCQHQNPLDTKLHNQYHTKFSQGVQQYFRYRQNPWQHLDKIKELKKQRLWLWPNPYSTQLEKAIIQLLRKYHDVQEIPVKPLEPTITFYECVNKNSEFSNITNLCMHNQIIITSSCSENRKNISNHLTNFISEEKNTSINT